MKNFLKQTGYWLRASLPALAILLAGSTVFRTAVVSSIESTPHPVLVYLIFGSFAVGLLMSWRTLYHFLREEKYLRVWRSSPASVRSEVRSRSRWKSELSPVYDLLDGKAKLPLRMRQAAVESELQEFDKGLSNRLSLPSYIGGALVGLGLVGTFIGLLGTLQDLASLFSSMMTNSEVNATQTQTELFQAMLSKLQAPMRSMGTAFVASLYGLLGSLILGLVVIAVRKTGDEVVAAVRQSVRELDYGSGGNLEVDGDRAWAESERWNTMYDDMRERNEGLISIVLQMQDETRDVMKSARELNHTMRERNELDGVIARIVAESTSVLARATEHYEGIMISAAATRTDIQAMVNATLLINQTLQQRNQIDAMVQQVLSNGPHWMDAWDQMNSELARLRSHAESASREEHALLGEQNLQLKFVLDSVMRQESGIQILTREIGTTQASEKSEQRDLLQGLKQCRESFEEVGSKLRLQLGLQTLRPDTPEPVKK
jgi:hypothetical protein